MATSAVILGSLVASPSSPASAADGVWCNAQGTCYIAISAPPSDPAPNPDANGWTAGAPTCYARIDAAFASEYPPDQIVVFEGTLLQYYVTIPCGNGLRYWSNARECYVSMVEGNWPARPSYVTADAGYYRCDPFVDQPSTITNFFWSNTIPPGLQVLTPGDAAAQLIASFQLRGIDIGMAPEINPEWGHRRSYVGVPVWLWVNNPEPLTWGPYEETATIGGQTITATAKVSAIRWQMGDGVDVVCGNIGTPYTIGYGVVESPTCGHVYARTSSRSAGDRYTVNAVSQWVVTWTSLSGASGTVNLSATSSTDLEINELQSVIVPNPSNG